MKIWWHKVTHWEYWSSIIVYLPTLFLWLFYAIKFRSVRFYAFANPGMKNGGLFGDGKYDMYKILPKGSYPKTIRIDHRVNNDFKKIIESAALDFPLIVKPDTGYKGIGVAMVASIEELIAYNNAAKELFLIQEIVDLPNELGLFYHRLPNERHGTISSITFKKLVHIKGDGQSTVETLIRRTPRFAMQIPKLATTTDLSEILPEGEVRCLVPFANHSRGTEFVDGSQYLTPQLVKTFDEILRKVPGFYYGRLDVRYNTLEELEKGDNYSIIEVNGAKSEPAHIYDTRYSFWDAQREIFKYQRVFMHIVEQNRAKDQLMQKQKSANPKEFGQFIYQAIKQSNHQAIKQSD